jgi:hypothetical protein
MTTQSRTKTEDMPAINVEGAGEAMLAESTRYLIHRHRAHAPANVFTDDEPTRPGWQHNQTKEG